MSPTGNSKKLTVGIVGVGRMGEAIARRLPKDINVLLADKEANGAKKLACALSVRAETIRETFLESDVVLLIVPPAAVYPLVREYGDIMKPNALLVNMATSIVTDNVQKEVKRRDIKVVGAKVIGQAYALLKGYKAVFILSTSDPLVVDLLKYLFSSIGRVIVCDEMLAEKINAEATRFGLRLAIDLRKQLKKICDSEEIVDVAVKTVAVGTILDYPLQEPNEYIEKRLKELKI